MTRFWYTWAVVIYRSLVSLIGIPGNILILAVYWDKQALGSAQVFIQTLALSDLYVCLLFPLEIHFWLHEFDYKDLLLCKLLFTLASIGWYMSILITVTIALDRYLAVAKPVNGRWSRRKAQKISISCIFVAIFINMAVPFSSHINFREVKGVVNGTTCYKQDTGGSGIALLVTIPQYLSCLAAFIFIVILYVKLWIVVARQRKKIGIKEVKYDDDTSVVGDKMSQAGSTKTNVVEYSVTNVQYTANDTAVGGKGTEADTRLETSGKSTERDSTETDVTGTDDRLNGHNDNKLQKAEDNDVRISNSRPALEDTIATGGSREENNKVTKSGDQLHPTNSKQPRSLTFANKVRRRRGQSHKVVSRLTLMLLLATAIFFITWFVTLATFALTPLTRPFFGNNIAYVMIALLRLSGLINHSINPLLYSFLNPKFRADCRTLFKRLKSRL
ncbi:uncharacterized protein [Apostichopus japonicus]|uniref:uncharacterized protein n=1 Tax=Stichopus japonicus TaxID=307972 RepID=UPI003AB90F23